MPGPRTLLTGPPGSDLRARAIDRTPVDPATLWLVPSPLARDQVIRLLAGRAKGKRTASPRVWTWDDAWRAAAGEIPEPPARLAPPALRAVLSEAIERSRSAGGLAALANSVGFAGYRRQLLGRFAAWTRQERHPARPSPDGRVIGLEEWDLFGRYRAVLDEIRAEDPAGWVVLASRAVGQAQGFRKFGAVVVLDPVEPSRAMFRLMDHVESRAKSVLVTLPFAPDPALAELYASVGPTRARFLDRGFAEEAVRADGLGLAGHGFGAIERELFRADADARPPLVVEDLQILGGPRGEGVGLLVAREVRDQIDRGRHPEEILILAPRVDDDAEAVRRVLASWGLPVAPSPSPRMATVPAISALRGAARLPVGDWEAKGLARLLRNGQVRWPELGPEARFDPFEAASAVRATRVYRRLDPLRAGLRRQADGDRPVAARDARSALGAVEHLAALLGPIARPGPWAAQVARLGQLADGLGLDPWPLEPLRDALDDYGGVLHRLGPAVHEQNWTWAEFVDEVDALIAADDPTCTALPPSPGAIRIEAVDAVPGARAAVVLLINLVERSFPRADAIDLDGDSVAVNPAESEAEGEPAPTPEAKAARAYGREMLRFARTVGAADERLVLAYPTTDLNGEALLAAGFLDELTRRLDPACLAALSERHARFDPVLADRVDLAVAAGDARVLAVADACLGRGVGSLRKLAATEAHSRALRGVAEAFRVAHLRRVERPLRHARRPAGQPPGGRQGPPELRPRPRLQRRASSNRSRSARSSSSSRYVLGLKPVDDGQELDEDYAGRGREVHEALEQVHQQMHGEGSDDLVGRLPILIETRMRAELEQFDGREADVAAVLREIAARRTGKALGRYAAQFRDYDRDAATPIRPDRFEVQFGQPDGSEPGPVARLHLGEGAAAVRLQGVIDRIDLIETDGETRFRVIDYKTGSNPSRRTCGRAWPRSCRSTRWRSSSSAWRPKGPGSTASATGACPATATRA